MLVPRVSAVLAVVATLLLLESCVHAAYRVKVPVVNGKCRYGGHKIPAWMTLQFKNPCESVQCMTRRGARGYAVVLSCSMLSQRLLCGLHKRGGKFPFCCKRPVCPEK
uniref:Single domain-containing protein n=1 Tax=Amblyomma cajennense TaxID=34607 RepID=A0A023FQV5_AMBCJ